MKRFHPAIALITAFLLLQSFYTAPGGDIYRIYLNDKMVVEQYVLGKEQSHSFSFSAPAETDRLVVLYSHCGQPGQDRSVQVKDKAGKLLKEWKFADSKNTRMQLKLKDVMQAMGKNHSASVYYTSKELVSGKLLTEVNFKEQKTAKL